MESTETSVQPRYKQSAGSKENWERLSGIVSVSTILRLMIIIINYSGEE